jgi:hypothetical protein
MKAVIYTNNKGGVAVCGPSGEVTIEEVQTNDVPAGVNSYIVLTSSLPAHDMDFFDAWEQADGVVTVSLGKAKEIAKRRLRIERAPLLQAQDVAFQRALETGADFTMIVAEKQRLRNITKLTDVCTALDELRTIKCN